MAIERQTLAELFEAQASRYTARTFLRQKRNGAWQNLSWADVDDAVQRVRTGLGRIGLGRGDRIAILAENSPEWVIVDQAALGLGAIVVPIYTTSGSDEMRHVLADSGAQLVAVGNAALMAKLGALGPLPGVQGILAMDEQAVPRDLHGIPVWALTALRNLPPMPARPGAPDDLATLIYTSGTTGPSKGVMLSHGNLLANCAANQAALDLNENDCVLSFLPIAHSFERTAGYYTVMTA